MIKPTFLIFLVLLACCVALLPEQSTSGREHCLCKRGGMLSVNMERVAKFEYHRPTSSCVYEELIVIFRNGQKRCLNLDGDQGRIIKQKIMERNNARK
ncbi:C-X-C motif chemokine 11-6-like [Pantherophis guttatus]|uniref:C-X-C motif chemokine 11-6-like n=1 Tax=Pantherophis guttatus TaxID=94885 RepID=A0A6P9CR45_PANGU|nr:C-X-C motif chemokine 11-6-like [Pantherophis guttatus]